MSGAKAIILKMALILKLNRTYQGTGYQKLSQTAFFAKFVELLAHTSLVSSICESSITWLAKHFLLYMKEPLQGQISKVHHSTNVLEVILQ